ncbi:MAG: ester cyclase [Alphaproteobacteria bacterium]|jgi:predicted ester cyclase|nr:ester cyclase [Alphaproteobacteria bacterium]
MTAQDNKELIRHIMEDGFNKKDIAVLYETFYPDYMRHGHGVGSMGSLEEHVADIKARHEAFDDARFDIQNILGDGDMVAVHYIFTGVHTGVFNGVAATGKKISRPSAAFFKVRDGKVVEGNVFADGAGLMAQLAADA